MARRRRNWIEEAGVIRYNTQRSKDRAARRAGLISARQQRKQRKQRKAARRADAAR